MEGLILFDDNMKEIGSIDLDVDIEVGTSDASNDFQIITSEIAKYNPAGFYIDGTEYGGFFEYQKAVTDSDIIEYKGFTWRGLMTKSLILPPSGSDYKIVSGEANSIISSILSGVLDGLFTVPATASGLTITSYQFPLYINTMDGLEKMLEKYGYRLSIHADKADQGITITVEAVEATQISGTYNNDSDVPMTFVNDQMGINHLLCAGQGELQNRMKVDLYLDENGNVSQTQTFTGFDERTAFYDYSSAESMADLIDNGTKRLLELASHLSLSIDSPDRADLEVGDIVQGTFPGGVVVRLPIVKKIFNITNGIPSTEIEIKGDS